MALMTTPVCEFGKPAIDFALPGVDEKIWTLADCRGSKGLLLMFICNHCPYVKAIWHNLLRDINALHALGINTVAIMSNDPTDYPEDSFSNMQLIAQEKQFSFPYLLDATQEVAKAYGAICTPDFFGYNEQLTLQYRGRFDASGKQAQQTTAPSDLYRAMTMIAETDQGPQTQIPSMGCSIKWKQDE